MCWGSLDFIKPPIPCQADLPATRLLFFFAPGPAAVLAARGPAFFRRLVRSPVIGALLGSGVRLLEKPPERTQNELRACELAAKLPRPDLFFYGSSIPWFFDSMVLLGSSCD
jgi:hypothetical protein